MIKFKTSFKISEQFFREIKFSWISFLIFSIKKFWILHSFTSRTSILIFQKLFLIFKIKILQALKKKPMYIDSVCFTKIIFLKNNSKYHSHSFSINLAIIKLQNFQNAPKSKNSHKKIILPTRIHNSRCILHQVQWPRLQNLLKTLEKNQTLSQARLFIQTLFPPSASWIFFIPLE